MQHIPRAAHGGQHMEIPLEAAAMMCDRRQQVYKLACDKFHMLVVVVSGCVTSHARWKWTTKKSSCRGDTSAQTRSNTYMRLQTNTHMSQKDRLRHPRKTHLAASIVQMAILPRVRQHPLACGANNRIHSAVHNPPSLMTNDLGAGVS